MYVVSKKGKVLATFPDDTDFDYVRAYARAHGGVGTVIFQKKSQK